MNALTKHCQCLKVNDLFQPDSSSGQQFGPANGQDGPEAFPDHRGRHEEADHDHQRMGGTGDKCTPKCALYFLRGGGLIAQR